MNSDNGCEPRGEEDQKNCDTNGSLGWAILNAPSFSEIPMENWFDCKYQEQYPTNTGKQNVESCESGAVVDEGDAKRK